MKRLIVAVGLVFAMSLAAEPGVARPEQCSPLQVWSVYPTGAGVLSVETEQSACNGSYLVTNFTGVPVDISAPFILPGALVEVVYEDDLGVATLDATIDGLGYHEETITLTRMAAGSSYVSERLEVEGGGSFTVSLALPGGGTKTASYNAV